MCSSVQSEVENHQAQLARFRNHLSSVKQDVRLMEEKLLRSKIASKKNQVSTLIYNPIKTYLKKLIVTSHLSPFA